MYVIWPSLDIIYHYRSIIVSGGYPENSFYYYYSLLDNRSLLMSHISILCWTSPFFWGSSVGSVGSARPCTEVKQEMCSVSDAMREYTKERRSGMTDWWWLATYIYIYTYFIFICYYIYNYTYIYIYVMCSFGDPVSQRGCHCTGGGALGRWKVEVREVQGACIAG